MGDFGVGMFSGLTGIFNWPNASRDGFSLSQNYPNPFSGNTNIDFEIAEKSFVSLKVVNVSGEELIELAGKEFLPGSYTVTFDASGFTKGIYFYSIKANGFSQTRKLIID